MRRKFLKRGQFNDTGACFLGIDFIGNGHWILGRQFSSNRKRFLEQSDADAFVKKEAETFVIEKTMEQVISEFTVDEPLKPCAISDLCIGKGVITTTDDSINYILAPYANLLKSITGSKDSLKGNSKILVAFDGDEKPGLVIMFFKMNDLITSNRNRDAVRKIAKEMFSKAVDDEQINDSD